MPSIYRNQDFLEIRRLVLFSLFVSIAILLSVIESFIPINFIIPGVKLGLSNIILLLLLDYYSFLKLLLYQFIRVVVSTFILGLFSVFLYSIVGAFFSLVLMYFAKRLGGRFLTSYTISMLGGIGHNVGQIIVASYLLKTSLIFGYLPFLLIFGCFSGFFIALISDFVLPHIRRLLDEDSTKEFYGS